PAKRSAAAMRKVHTRTLDDRTPTHSFRTLLTHLSGIVRNTCRLPNAPTFQVVTTPTAKQQHALDLLGTIRA
ncbi:MAG: IS1634 family transposase, partial [Woeseiaceae bacterium]